MSEQELIAEARRRGYHRGTPLDYKGMLPGIDYCEGNFFEVNQNGDLVAFAKPQHLRRGFDDWRFDTLYKAKTKTWTAIAGGPIEGGINL